MHVHSFSSGFQEAITNHDFCSTQHIPALSLEIWREPWSLIWDSSTNCICDRCALDFQEANTTHYVWMSPSNFQPCRKTMKRNMYLTFEIHPRFVHALIPKSNSKPFFDSPQQCSTLPTNIWRQKRILHLRLTNTCIRVCSVLDSKMQAQTIIFDSPHVCVVAHINLRPCQ